MSLRLRLTLTYTFLLTVVLVLAGAALHYALAKSLTQSLDASLKDTLVLAKNLIDQENQTPRLHQEGESLTSLPPDLGLFLWAGNQLVDRAGYTPVVPDPHPGCNTEGSWRFCAERAHEGWLIAGRPTKSVDLTLDRLDRVLLVLFPTTIVLGLLLGYAFSARALSPLDAMTRKALALAEAKNAKGRLPEPKTHDEVFRLARAQNLLLAVLEKELDRERRFAQSAAHELRTPLAVLLGRLERALENTPIPRDQILKARDAAHDLWQLVERLLQLARTGRVIQKTAVDLGDLVVLAVERFSWGSPSLVLEMGGESCISEVDPLMVEAAITNLLDNARKFARSKVNVELRCREGDAWVVVGDDGPGIPEEVGERVFEAFYQISPSHRRQGSGLGLAFVKAVAEAHHGRIWVERSVLGGAQFTLALKRSPI